MSTKTNFEKTTSGEFDHQVSEFTQAMDHLRAGGIGFDLLGDDTDWAFHPMLSMSPQPAALSSRIGRNHQAATATAA